MSRFKEIAESIIELHEKKNQDYGNAFSDTLKEFGMPYALGTLSVKLKRIKSVTNSNEPNFESVIDSLKDLAAYAIMLADELS